MNQELTPIQAFKKNLLDDRSIDSLSTLLGEDISVDAFTRVVMRAVQENPELLQADQKTLFFACERAAQDRLLPDGKDGYLGIYNTNTGTQQQPNWVKKVAWHPMIEGMRKILAQHKIALRAELVYSSDEFSYEKGDNPHLIHRCDVFATDRGEMIGAYAIAEDMLTGAIIGREAMNTADLEQVRAASKNPNGAVWKKWPGQMYRKAPARRLFAAIPKISALLKTVIESDNATFDLNKPEKPTQAAQDVQAAIRKPAPELEKPNPEHTLQPVVDSDTQVDETVIEHAAPEQEQVPLEEYAGVEPDF